MNSNNVVAAESSKSAAAAADSATFLAPAPPPPSPKATPAAAGGTPPAGLDRSGSAASSHGFMTVRCPLCSYQSTQKSNLTRHFESFHITYKYVRSVRLMLSL